MPASRRLAWILLAILALTRHPAVAATTPAGAATPARIVRAAPDVKLQAWQARLRAVREAPGCYKAHYPDKGWTRVPCLPARLTNARPPNVRLRSQSGAHPATVGNFNDYMAQSSSGTKSAVGTIIELDNLTSESDSGFGNGKYSLQMNTAGFSPPSGVCPSCTGAVQFYYDQNGGGILVQFWMLGYIAGKVTACPGGWQQNGAANCYKNGLACNATNANPVAPAPVVPLANVTEVTLTGEADAGGNDTITLAYGHDIVMQSACDNILSLAGRWTDTEFNIFGDFNGDAATFNAGVLATVTIALTDTTADFPACTTVAASSSSSTVETTNMDLAACTPTRPGIRFVEGVRPRVAGISPSSGSQDGGTAVTIAGATDAAGSGFSKFMQASFGSTYVGVTCNGNDCSADAPAGTGTVPVAIENLTSAGAPGPPDSQSFNFGYAVYPYGIMSPSTGPVGGGTGVVLSGHGLGLAPGATTITFGFTSGAVEVATSSCGPVSSPNGEISQQCSFTTPPLPNPPGSGTTVVPVSATVAGLTSEVGGFTYGSAAPPVKVTCAQCRQMGEMCVIRNGQTTCQCQRSSPKGNCI